MSGAEEIRVEIEKKCALGLVGVDRGTIVLKQGMLFLLRLLDAPAWKKREFSSQSVAIFKLKR